MTEMKKIKTGLCSFGMSGWVFHAPFVHANEKFELKAVVERSKKTAAEKYPGIISYGSIEELMADDSLDLIVVNTPNYTHYDFTKLALESGKHVIVEKVFTSTKEQAAELIALAKEKNKCLSVFQNRRWDSDFLTVKKIVDEELIGKTVEAEIHYDRFSDILSYKTHKETPGPGAGILPDLGPHLIDQALQLFGKPRAVFADATNLRPISLVPDYMEVILFYEGLRVRLKGSYLVREALPAFIFHGDKGSFIKKRADVQEADLQKEKKPGTNGWGTEAESDWGLLHTEIDGEIVRKNIPAEQGNYMKYYDAMAEAILEGTQVPVTAEDGMAVVEIVEACYKSIDQKKCINL